MSETKKFKMVGGKKYTLNKKGVYVDKDGYAPKALGYQIPKKSGKKKLVIMGGQKYKKNAKGEWHKIVPEKKSEKILNKLRIKKKKKKG